MSHWLRIRDGEEAVEEGAVHQIANVEASAIDKYPLSRRRSEGPHQFKDINDFQVVVNTVLLSKMTPHVRRLTAGRDEPANADFLKLQQLLLEVFDSFVHEPMSEVRPARRYRPD
jgi:hypothetical protein